MSAQTESVRRLSVVDIAKLYADGVRIATITAYDFPTAALVDEAGVPLILVGDSLAQVMLGYDTTVRVTMDEMLHHTKAVVRGTKRALIVGDMPFLSYSTPEDALRNAGRFLREGGVAGGQGGGRRPQRAHDRGDREGRHPGDGPHRADAPGHQRDGQGPGPGQDPRAGPTAPRRRARGPGGRRVRGRARARARTARRRDHRAAADPDHRHRRRRRLLGPDPGHHRHAGLRRLDAEARAPVRGPARDDPRGGRPVQGGRRGRDVPGDAETVRMDPAVLDEVLGRSADDRADRAGRLAGIPLDRDL